MCTALKLAHELQLRNTPGANIVLPGQVAQFIELALDFLHLRLRGSRGPPRASRRR